MTILATNGTIVNIKTAEEFFTSVADCSNINRTRYPEINDNNQYKVRLEFNKIFGKSIILGEYATQEQANAANRKIFNALKNKEDTVDMNAVEW